MKNLMYSIRLADLDAYRTYASCNFFNTVDTRIAIKLRFGAYLADKHSCLWETICDERNNTPEDVDNNRLVLDVLIHNNRDWIPMRFTYHESEYKGTEK